jgi:hypothetical protein
MSEHELTPEKVAALEKEVLNYLTTDPNDESEQTCLALIAFYRSHQSKEETKEPVCRHCGETRAAHKTASNFCESGNDNWNQFEP